MFKWYTNLCHWWNADTIQSAPVTFKVMAVIELLQLWMQRGKQNRIPVEPKFDGRGVPGEAYNQLGRDPVGKTTVRAVDDRVRTGAVRIMRIVTPHVHRLQGNTSLLILYNFFTFFGVFS